MVKNREIRRLVQELTSLTGEGEAKAIAKALRERLERIRNKPEQGLAERMLAIGRDCAAHLKGHRSIDHGDLLYGKKDGLPR